MTKYLRVGVITRPHGIRGEVKVYPTTEGPERFGEIDRVLLKRSAGDKTIRELSIDGVKLIRTNAVLKFRGVDTVEEAERLRGLEMYIPREEGVLLREGEYYIGDIIDMNVVSDRGEYIGVVRDVLKTGANDVYVVKREGDKDLLIPVIDECIVDTDIRANKLTVHIMDGLLDL